MTLLLQMLLDFAVSTQIMGEGVSYSAEKAGKGRKKVTSSAQQMQRLLCWLGR